MHLNAKQIGVFTFLNCLNVTNPLYQFKDSIHFGKLSNDFEMQKSLNSIDFGSHT